MIQEGNIKANSSYFELKEVFKSLQGNDNSRKLRDIKSIIYSKLHICSSVIQ